MPQELNVLKCYACNTFQVHIVKKATKWCCKICNEKQSIKKVFGIGSGKDCRILVQKLNTEQQLAKENAPVFSCNTSSLTNNEENLMIDFKDQENKWSQFLTPHDEEVQIIHNVPKNYKRKSEESQEEKSKRLCTFLLQNQTTVDKNDEESELEENVEKTSTVLLSYETFNQVKVAEPREVKSKRLCDMLLQNIFPSENDDEFDRIQNVVVSEDNYSNLSDRLHQSSESSSNLVSVNNIVSNFSINAKGNFVKFDTKSQPISSKWDEYIDDSDNNSEND